MFAWPRLYRGASRRGDRESNTQHRLGAGPPLPAFGFSLAVTRAEHNGKPGDRLTIGLISPLPSRRVSGEVFAKDQALDGAFTRRTRVTWGREHRTAAKKPEAEIGGRGNRLRRDQCWAAAVLLSH
jgi:hypothetical protein